MSPQQIDQIRRELHTMRQESAAAHRELRSEMQGGFARLEKRLDRGHSDHERRIRTLEIERGKLAGWLAAVAAGAGGAAGFLGRLFGGE